MDGDRRTYTGWKAGLVVIGTIVVAVWLVNVVARHYAPLPKPAPSPTVITVSPPP